MQGTLKLKVAHLGLGDLISQAEALKSNGEITEAVHLYQAWIESTNSDERFIAYFNLGVLLADLSRAAEAEAAYRSALDLKPAFMQARINLGLLLEKSGKSDLAIEEWKVIWQSKQNTPDWISNACLALNHTGRLHESNREFEKAEEALEMSLRLNKKQSDAIQHWFHIRQKQCKWPALESGGLLTTNEVIASASPLATLAMTDDTAVQWISAANFVSRKFKVEEGQLWNGPLVKREKIRIGYVSGDLCTHAVGLLMADVIENHNKEQFEVFAFDFSPEDGSAHRDRLKRAFDYFIDIRKMSDKDAAVLIRRCDIDVLVDMHGLSSGARPGIFALRPSQIQVAYLGYLGTTAMPWIDYVITDRYCLTEENEAHLTERPIVVDGCSVPLLSPNDTPEVVRKSDYGLRDDALVLGCFNNIYKFTPEMIQIWANIAKTDPNSVLWLLDDNKWATRNLSEAFSKFGLREEQLVFAKRCTHSEYKRRLKAVDIYLDTFPYNAGSTAWDVLEAGVPMVTMSGRSYMSRVAGSMLTTAGLGELVTTSHDEYKKKIIHLMKPGPRLRIKKRIEKSKKEWASVAPSLVGSLERSLKDLLKIKTENIDKHE